VFIFSQKVQQIVGILRVSNELISSPIMFTANDSKIVQHNELPEVTNEVSITLRLNITSHHDTKWACVFHKGRASLGLTCT
jgi:hypothetical protein